MQQLDVHPKEKNRSGNITLLGALLFMVLLTVFSVDNYFKEPVPSDATRSDLEQRLAIRLPLNPRGNLEMVLKDSVSEMQTVPSRYTHRMSVDPSNCSLKLRGVNTKTIGTMCQLVIDRHIWAEGLVTGEPQHIRPAPSNPNELSLMIDGKMVLFLNNPAMSPRYPLPVSALGNHVLHYTPRGVVQVDFE